ncbi:uncharacterized protein SPSK_06522 [Sporothrix schenckii 1099-18]|uniref:DUF8021 domain-containing protein n=2 Tax=Sporothrix schenckii TaxID=29908 RepID=U7PHZ8_SPOS1|nr:uncharacterized protein SPSK_06522 [Sporothrix schenckii 1099-18]ERS95218.1 hypothetical protein HMPREF1624_08429 [Sporothrix schenckii ATCC 58251]KJR90016.1 hypothetical protein SPSK_06522 [Sporothrix schenckii 1099-18]
MLGSLFLLAATVVSAADVGGCTRDLLQAVADSVVAAQTAGNPALLQPAAAADAMYTENRQPATSLAAGILSHALKPDHVRSSLDTTQCATYTEMIVATGAKPYEIGVQVFLAPGDASAVHRVDTIYTSTGDWLFNITGTLYWASRETWGPIPEAQRDTRAVIQAAADAYCDVFSNKSTVVPWGTPCARLEGGSYTGKGSASDSCNVGIPSGVSLTQRRYVIDEVIGAVDVFMSFANLPDSHDFRVEGGKLRYVHTMTVMTGGKGKSSGGGGGTGGKGAKSRRSVTGGVKQGAGL